MSTRTNNIAMVMVCLGVAACNQMLGTEEGRLRTDETTQGASGGGGNGASEETGGGSDGGSAAEDGSSSSCNTTEQWGLVMRHGSSGNDYAFSANADGAGNVYVTGTFEGTVDLGGQTLTALGKQDAFIAMYSKTGSLQWAVSAGGTNNDWGEALVVNPAGGVYVVGRGVYAMTFNSTDGQTKATTSVNSEIAWIAKYDAKGVLEWLNTGTGSGNGNASGVAFDPTTGGVYLTGRLHGTETFTSTDGSLHSVQGKSNWHSFIAKYDSNGVYQWAHGSWCSPNCAGNAVTTDAQGNAYVAGWSEGSVQFDGSNGALQSAGISPYPQSKPDYPGDGFLVKYSPVGNVEWVTKLGGYKAGYQAVDVSPDGIVRAVGYAGNLQSGSPTQLHTILTSTNGTTYDLGTGHLTTPFNMDGVVAIYDINGKVLSGRRYGGPLTEAVTGIAHNASNDFVISGIFSGVISIDGVQSSGTGPRNAFVAKHDATNQIQWVLNADNVGYDYWGYVRSSMGADGNWYVAAPYEGTAQVGPITLPNAGGYDAIVARIDSACTK